ncbi:MAG: TrpB-like pyridoxal phosphate-dependent enzyme, partial [Planctomycetota bacterium]
LWAQTEGMICAPETSHAVAAAIQEAKKAKEEGKEKFVLFNYSGHGLMDMTAYDAFLAGKLERYHLPDEELAKTEEILKSYPPAEIHKSGKW